MKNRIVIEQLSAGLVNSIALWVIVFGTGCQTPTPSPEQLDQGLIWMFPGIEGGDWSLDLPRRSFREAGVQSAISTYQWKYPFGSLLNLADYKTNRKGAAEVAAQIADYQRQYPNRPIDLVGYSGGGGMAIMTAEALPLSVNLRNIILIHPAVSRDYDLTKTLQHLDGKLVNFYSPLDWLFLGVGTTVFGTMDRVHTVSAGKDGFDETTAIPNEKMRAKLKQVRWSRQMIPTGHLGGHIPILFYWWNKNYVAPHLLPN